MAVEKSMGISARSMGLSIAIDMDLDFPSVTVCLGSSLVASRRE
jgi:hypothetical protein